MPVGARATQGAEEVSAGLRDPWANGSDHCHQAGVWTAPSHPRRKGR